MDSEELLERVRELRAKGRSPKEIARALAVSPAAVAPLVRAIAAREQSDPDRPEVVECWISPGWSEGLTLERDPRWPDIEETDLGTAGLASILVARHKGRDKVRVCGYLVDVYCLGVKNIVGPRSMTAKAMVEFTRSYFDAYQGSPLPAPLDLVQHVVFGAIHYARGLGFEPAPDFGTVAEHLGPWTGPSAIGFGRHGKPFYVQGPRDNAAAVLRTLRRSVGQDNYHFLVGA